MDVGSNKGLPPFTWNPIHSIRTTHSLIPTTLETITPFKVYISLPVPPGVQKLTVGTIYAQTIPLLTPQQFQNPQFWISKLSVDLANLQIKYSEVEFRNTILPPDQRYLELLARSNASIEPILPIWVQKVLSAGGVTYGFEKYSKPTQIPEVLLGMQGSIPLLNDYLDRGDLDFEYLMIGAGLANRFALFDYLASALQVNFTVPSTIQPMLHKLSFYFRSYKVRPPRRELRVEIPIRRGVLTPRQEFRVGALARHLIGKGTSLPLLLKCFGEWSSKATYELQRVGALVDTLCSGVNPRTLITPYIPEAYIIYALVCILDREDLQKHALRIRDTLEVFLKVYTVGQRNALILEAITYSTADVQPTVGSALMDLIV